MSRLTSSLVIILTLALGTGLNSAVLAVTYGILFRPLPYRDSSRLVQLDHRVPFGEVINWQSRLRTVDNIGVYASADHALRGLGEPRIVRVDFVSDRFFDV